MLFRSKSHARAVEKLGGEVIGAFDVSENALKSFKKEFYCDVISYEQIPEYVEKADYAVISTPPTKRLDYVEMVLSKHVPLYLEKPIATTLEDAEKIVAMAKQYDAKIIVGFAHPSVLRLSKCTIWSSPACLATPSTRSEEHTSELQSH